MGNKKGRRQVTGLRGHLKRHFLQRNFLYSKIQFRFSPQALENRHYNIALRNFSVLNECRHILAPNAMTSEAHVCRLILTPHLFITFLNSARFCSKPSSLFWMSKNQSLPWLFEFGLWTVAMRRWCLRVQLTWRPLQRQRGLCGAGTRLCNEPPTTACPGGGNKLAVKHCNCLSSNIYSERGSRAVRSVQIHDPSTSVGSSLEKSTWRGKAGGMTQLQEIKWPRKRKLNGPGRFYKYVIWGLWQIRPHIGPTYGTCVSPVHLCDSTMLGVRTL